MCGKAHVRVALANAQEGKVRKGHKTDNQDAWWLAHLLRHGMVTARAARVAGPDAAPRKLIPTASAEKNRVSKMLEDANVKLGSALADVFGVSGQRMLEALLKGKADATRMASFARARARKKIPALIAALE